jgi:hypothetical protein
LAPHGRQLCGIRSWLMLVFFAAAGEIHTIESIPSPLCYLIQKQQKIGLLQGFGIDRGLAFNGPLSYSTEKCSSIFRRHYGHVDVCAVLVGSFFERCPYACCDRCCGTGSQQNNHVYLRPVAWGNFHCPEVRSDFVAMDAQP